MDLLAILNTLFWLSLIAGAILFPLNEFRKLRNRARQAEERAALLQQELVDTVEDLSDAEASAAEAARLLVQQQQETAAALARAGAKVPARPAARPLDNPPPGFGPSLDELKAILPEDRYGFCAGWQIERGQPTGVVWSFHGDSPAAVYFVSLTGEIRMGKDGAAAHILAGPLSRCSPAQLQIVILEGKRPDGALFAGIPHNFVEPCFKEDAADLMAVLRLERERRERLLVRYRRTRWEELPPIAQPPLLLVYISEIRILAGADPNFEGWLGEEYSVAAAAGIRYITGIQSLNGLSTAWRDQAGLKLSAALSADRQIEPALGMRADELRKLGAVPPTELPAPGYFTFREKGQAGTFRTSLVTVEERVAFLEGLGQNPNPISVQDRRKELEQLAKTGGAMVALPRPAPLASAGSIPAPIMQELRDSSPARVYDIPFEEFRAAGLSDTQIARVRELLPTWYDQIVVWNREELSRNDMVERMGVAKNVGLATIRVVLGATRKDAPVPNLTPAEVGG